MNKTIRIGTGAAWRGDRVEPAPWSAERGKLEDRFCIVGLQAEQYRVGVKLD